MGVMKRSLLFGIFVVALFTLPATASVTVEETTDAEYVINQGYSQAVAEDIFVAKNRANGKPVEPLYDKKQNKLVKFFKGIWAYADPSLDDPDRLHHDIKLSPSYSDL